MFARQALLRSKKISQATAAARRGTLFDETQGLLLVLSGKQRILSTACAPVWEALEPRTCYQWVLAAVARRANPQKCALPLASRTGAWR